MMNAVKERHEHGDFAKGYAQRASNTSELQNQNYIKVVNFEDRHTYQSAKTNTAKKPTTLERSPPPRTSVPRNSSLESPRWKEVRVGVASVRESQPTAHTPVQVGYSYVYQTSNVRHALQSPRNQYQPQHTPRSPHASSPQTPASPTMHVIPDYPPRTHAEVGDIQAHRIGRARGVLNVDHVVPPLDADDILPVRRELFQTKPCENNSEGRRKGSWWLKQSTTRQSLKSEKMPQMSQDALLISKLMDEHELRKGNTYTDALLLAHLMEQGRDNYLVGSPASSSMSDATTTAASSPRLSTSESVEGVDAPHMHSLEAGMVGRAMYGKDCARDCVKNTFVLADMDQLTWEQQRLDLLFLQTLADVAELHVDDVELTMVRLKSGKRLLSNDLLVCTRIKTPSKDEQFRIRRALCGEDFNLMMLQSGFRVRREDAVIASSHEQKTGYYRNGYRLDERFARWQIDMLNMNPDDEGISLLL